LNARWGSAFSLEPVLHQSAFFRTHNRDKEIPNLYFVGAGTHPGAGIPGVVGSAKATAGLILEDVKGLPVGEVKAPSEKTLAQECQQIIQSGSKSFSLASRLFDSKTQEAACFLYGWCRYVDDAIDEIEDKEVQKKVLEELKKETEQAFEGKPSSKSVFRALARVARDYQIPKIYALELLEGMQMDVENQRYQNLSDLGLYCYRVAGCVGLMMSHIMGVSEKQALSRASDLGIAMQLTNIARDIVTDARMGRVYLPQNELAALGVTDPEVANPLFRTAVAHVVRKILREADLRYRSGVQGLSYLPLRSSFAVAMAISVYWQIGKAVEARREKAWDSRTVVSKTQKVFCLLKASGWVLKTLPYRLLKPWKREDNLEIWRFQWNAAELS